MNPASSKQAALMYARRGWRVFPLVPRSKFPKIDAWQHEATTDTATIEKWWTKWPDAGVGVATGSGSRVLVLDVDGGDLGVASLRLLAAEYGPLPETLTATTGGGGTHYIFECGVETSNSASKIGKKLDVRGDGGYIVVWPSVSEKGPYRWNTPMVPVAPAPEWFAEFARKKIKPSAIVKRKLPAANEVTVDAAREALTKHGPAKEGEGGDTHTYRAAAILTHDFGFTHEEAWPLLAEWNETCEPPWDEEKLREKLENGDRYGSGQYGSKRTFQRHERALQIINEHAARGSQPIDVIHKLNQELKDGISKAERAIVVREFTLKLGEKPEGLTTKKPHTRETLAPGQIEVTNDVNADADKATEAISERVYQRNGRLVEIAKSDGRSYISELRPERIQDLMAAEADFVRMSDEGELKTTPAPLSVARIIHSRVNHDGVRELHAVTQAPIFLPDGSILQAKGYDPQTKVYFEPDVEVSVPENPDRKTARNALATLADLMSDFRFEGRADFSTWVASILTPLCKAALKNAPAPLFVMSASSAGAGKTLLAELAAIIVTGSPAENRTYAPLKGEEWGKRITAYVKAAAPMCVFDNVRDRFGDETLDRLVTSTTWADRILGASEAPPLPVVSTWLMTGNNIEPREDTVRRTAFVRLRVDEERPQEREGFKYDPIREYAAENRAKYLTAALTVLRAYHAAGKPPQTMPAWGSFESWSRLVRGALVWAGAADPFETQRRISKFAYSGDTEVHEFWLRVVDESNGTPAEIAQLANRSHGGEVLGTRDELTAHGLDRFLLRFVDKPLGGKKIRRDRDEAARVTKYWVERFE